LCGFDNPHIPEIQKESCMEHYVNCVINQEPAEEEDLIKAFAKCKKEWQANGKDKRISF